MHDIARVSLRLAILTSGPFGVAAALLLILNLGDAIFTLGFVQLGAATEANPLMAHLLADGPIAFMLVKLGLVSACVALLWRLQSNRAAIVALFTCVGVYVVLLGYHLSAIRPVAQHFAQQ